MKSLSVKGIVLLLCVALLLPVFAACGSKGNEQPSPTAQPSITAEPTEQAPKIEFSNQLNKTGMPVVKEPVKLKVMAGKIATQTNMADMLIWKEYEKMSGVQIEWIDVLQNDLPTKRNLAIASGDLPDVFFKCNIPSKDLQANGEQGIFVKLNDYIPELAPNFQKVLEENKDIEKGLSMVGGNIYSLPYIMDVLSPAITGKMFLNREWVDKLGMKMPETTEELYNVLTAIKNTDLNGNGEQDEIPLSGPNYRMVLSTFRGAFGLGNRGGTVGNIDLDESTGKVRYWPSDPNYKELLMYMNKLYSEKLLDQEIFESNTKLTAKGAQNRVGSFSAINHNAMGPKFQNDYEGLTKALKGPNGDELWSPINSRIWDKGAFAITNVNKYPDITMRWVDYFYSEEGVKLYFMGKEGVSYQVTSEGKYEYVDEITKNPNGLTYDQAMGQYVAWGGLGNPSIAMDKYFLGAAVLPIPLEAANRVEPYLPKEIWSEFSYTTEENEMRIQYETDLNGYVDEMTAQFISGKVSFDQWDNYVNNLKNMDLDKYLEICQAAYDRYKAN